MFKAFISDLDDTLLNREHRLDERTQQTLRRLMEKGMRVILASGRSAASIRPYARQLGTQDPLIAFNGAQILSASGEKLLSHELEVPLARQALEWLREHDLYAQIYDGDDWFYETPCIHSENYCRSSGIVGKQVPSLLAFLSRPTPKILAVDTPARIAQVRPLAQAAFGGRLNATTSCPHFLEITAPGADKGQAVADVARLLGLTPEDTICAGDSLNDLPMLRWTHHPLTVSNARPEVLAMARYTAGSAYEDGVAELLEALIP